MVLGGLMRCKEEAVTADEPKLSMTGIGGRSLGNIAPNEIFLPIAIAGVTETAPAANNRDSAR